MKDDIIVRGIQTNNLKNIDVCLKKNAINLIIGPSGSGKSSLAYDTIAQIGLHELGAMYYDGVNEPDYKVDSYTNMVVTIPIKQNNNNNNVRSTVATYFSISPCLAKIFSMLLNIPYDFFVLNKSENICPICSGIGYVKTLDPHKIIDYDKTLEEVPVRCWKKNKDFYKQILKLFCLDRKIPYDKKFRQLSEKQKKEILFGTSETKYKIKYKVTNHFSTRTTQYYGPMTDIPMLKSFAPSADFFSEILCEKCCGEKYEIGHRKYKICGLSIGEILILSFDNLLKWIDRVKSEHDCTDIAFSINQIESFAKKAIELRLGYISLNRTIPSLSGGELQRLRLIQVFSSQLTDLLIVLDEPLAGLSSKEKEIVYKNILQLKKKHTLLIVDHHELFVNDAAKIIALGECGGKKGGKLIDANEYLNKQSIVYAHELIPANKYINMVLKSNVYNYAGTDITIALKTLNLISGASGVGKSTLLREYFPQYFDDYLYISQKPMGGNVRSTVATCLGISNSISQMFAKKFKLEKTMFSNLSTAEGMCPKCAGTGIITYGSESQSQITLSCKDCCGTGFDKKLQKYKYDDKTIQDIWLMTIDDAVEFFDGIDAKVFAILKSAQNLLLGHLQIGEKTSHLSGGENIRLKLMSALTAKNPVIGIDEPFKGLGNEEIFMVIRALDKLVEMKKTVIVVDHEEKAFDYFTNHIYLINDGGVLKTED